MTICSELRLIASEFDLLALHETAPKRYPFLLQSNAAGTGQGRYDLLLVAGDEHLSLDSIGSLSGRVSRGETRFLDALDQWWLDESDPTARASGLPFLGGWFVYLSYELAGEIEPTLRLPKSEGALPVALAVRCPAAIIRDHALGETWVVAEADGAGHMDTILTDLESLSDMTEDSLTDHRVAEEPAERYCEFVDQIREYILAGDVFQVNVSRRWTAPSPHTPTQLYSRLRSENPAPFAGLMCWQDSAVVSSSPERLVERRGDILETRPIAGTRQRGVGVAEDKMYSGELLASPKERAEHIMLIDLERNDLGRVCVPGSVQVNEMMVIESYAHVHHIVSNIRGRARPGLTPGETIAAVFPGGTITGCPKVRCMEIIAELEQRARGAYTGAFGYLDRSGDMDLNILIRSLTLHDGVLDLRAGGGIVADSDPSSELEETRHKAQGLLRALRT